LNSSGSSSVALSVTSTDTRRIPSATGSSSVPIPGMAMPGRAAEATCPTTASPSPMATSPGPTGSSWPVAQMKDQTPSTSTATTAAATASGTSSCRRRPPVSSESLSTTKVTAGSRP
jgi:hypothetical protein